MDRLTLTLLIHDKLADGRLPHNHIPRMWGGPGNGETATVATRRNQSPEIWMGEDKVLGRAAPTSHAPLGTRSSAKCAGMTGGPASAVPRPAPPIR